MASVKFGYNVDEVTDANAKENIETLRQWLSNENLPDLTNEQIFQFLLRSNHDLAAAKVIIKTSYDLKANAPSIFTNRSVRNDLQKCFEKIEICTMPIRTEDGCAIIYVRLADTNYKNVNMEDYFKLLFMTIDGLTYQEPLPGIVGIFDLSGISLMHLTRLKMSILKLSILYFQDGLPVTLKAAHCINTVSFIDAIMKLVRPFTKNELLEKVHFHSRNLDMETFYSNHLPKQYLPEEMGGELPSTKILHQRNAQSLSDLEEHFAAEENQRNSG